MRKAKRLECPFLTSALVPYYCKPDCCPLYREFNFGKDVGLVSGCAVAVTADLLAKLYVRLSFQP